MTKLPIVDARTMEKVLAHLGFAPVRQKGGHVVVGYSPTLRDDVGKRIRELLAASQQAPTEK